MEPWGFLESILEIPEIKEAKADEVVWDKVWAAWISEYSHALNLIDSKRRAQWREKSCTQKVRHR